MSKLAVKKVPPGVANDVRSIANGEKDLDHPYYNVEQRKGTGKATCRHCDETIKEGEPTIYFHYAPEDDNVWIRTRGTIHADNCGEEADQQWTKCPKCRKQVPREDWRGHWQKEKGKRVAAVHTGPASSVGYDACPSCDGEAGCKHCGGSGVAMTCGDCNRPVSRGPRATEWSHSLMPHAEPTSEGSCEACDKPAAYLVKANPETPAGRPVCSDHLPPGMKRFAEVANPLTKSPKYQQGLDPNAGETSNTTSMGDTGEMGLDQSAGAGADFPDEYEPRVDPNAGAAVKDTQMGQLDQEARKLQRGMKGIDQFAGKFKSPWKVINKMAARNRKWWEDDGEKFEECPHCDNGRAYDGRACSSCRGSGMREKYNSSPVPSSATGMRRWNGIDSKGPAPEVYPQEHKTCNSCDGSGQSAAWSGGTVGRCWTCKGTGDVAPRDPRNQFEHILNTYGGNKHIVGLSNNTGLHEDEDEYHVKLHSTDVLDFHKEKPEVTINTNGWDSVTTKDRVNSYINHAGLSLHSTETEPGQSNLVVSTPKGAYYHKDGLTINTETGLEASGREPDLKKCPECWRLREPDEMVKHMKRHETYKQNYLKSPTRKCGECNGQGNTDPWHVECKDCKATGMELNGTPCDNCRGAGLKVHPGATSVSAYGYGMSEEDKAAGASTCYQCKGRGVVDKRRPNSLGPETGEEQL